MNGQVLKKKHGHRCLRCLTQDVVAFGCGCPSARAVRNPGRKALLTGAKHVHQDINFRTHR
jgi:hypothetical protein